MPVCCSFSPFQRREVKPVAKIIKNGPCSTGHFGIKPSIFSRPNWGHSQITPFPRFFIVPSPKKTYLVLGRFIPMVQSPSNPRRRLFLHLHRHRPSTGCQDRPGIQSSPWPPARDWNQLRSFPSQWWNHHCNRWFFFGSWWRIGCVPLRCELSWR